MTAATYIPLAKVLDLWGRAEGFLLMASFATLGMVLMAVSHNLPTFCAAYVSPDCAKPTATANLGHDRSSIPLGSEA